MRARYLPDNLNTYTSRDLLFNIDNKMLQENEAVFIQVENTSLTLNITHDEPDTTK